MPNMPLNLISLPGITSAPCDVDAIVAAPVAAPIATPVAAPVAAPIATLVAAPVAAPTTTPVAAPVAAPIAALVAAFGVVIVKQNYIILMSNYYSLYVKNINNNAIFN